LIPDYQNQSCCDGNSNDNLICWKSSENKFCSKISSLYSGGPKFCSQNRECNPNEICVTPQIGQNESIYLFALDNGEESLLISSGSIPIGLSSVEPKWSWISNKSVIILDYTEQFIFCLKLVAFGFVITNCLPIKRLDGEHLFREIIHKLLPLWTFERKEKLLSYVLTIGMIVAFSSLGISIFSTIYNTFKS